MTTEMPQTGRVWRFGVSIGVIVFGIVVGAIATTLMLFGQVTVEQALIGNGVGIIVATAGAAETQRQFGMLAASLSSE